MDRRLVWALVGGLGVLVAVGLWVVPNFAMGKVRRTAGTFGLVVTTSGAPFGLSGLRVPGMKVTSEAGGLSADLRGVSVAVNPFTALWSVRGAVRSVGMDGAVIEIDASNPGLPASLRALFSGLRGKGDANAKDGGGAAAALPKVNVHDVSLKITDADGAVVQIKGLWLEGDGAQWEGGAKELQLGALPGDQAVLRDLTWKGKTQGGRAVIESVDGLAGDVRVSRRLEANQTKRTTRDRILDFRDLVRKARSGATAKNEDAAGASRFAEGFVVNLAGIDVGSEGEKGNEPVLSDLSLTVEDAGKDLWSMKGSGKPMHGGALRWDFSVWPRDLRANGSLAFDKLPLTLLLPFMPKLPWYQPERAALSGKLQLTSDGGLATKFDGAVHLSDVALSSERIAPNPVTGIDFGVESAGTWRPTERRLELTKATVTMRGARLGLNGVFEWAADHYLVDMVADMPSTPCSAALSAIPNDLLDGVSGFSWAGSMAGHMTLKVDSRKLADTKLNLAVQDQCTFMMVPQMADLRRFRGPFTHRVLEPDDTWFEMETGPGTANWTPISEMSPFLPHAVLAHEDGGFFGHGGFAVWAIEGALKRNLEAGRYVVGASTITMQLAKNIFLHREKTLARKVQEVLLTWWLESALSKKEILELYLNVIEYGPGIYGMRNATKHYFGCEPHDVSLAEAAFLANILPNPKLYHSNYDGGLSPKMANRMNSLIKYMASKGRVDAVAVQEAAAQIAAFKFVHPGEERAQRMDLGKAAPLAYEGGDAAPLDANDQAWDNADRGDEDEAN